MNFKCSALNSNLNKSKCTNIQVINHGVAQKMYRFWVVNYKLKEARPCMNREKYLLSLRGTLLGYNFETRPNSRELATADLVILWL